MIMYLIFYKYFIGREKLGDILNIQPSQAKDLMSSFLGVDIHHCMHAACSACTHRTSCSMVSCTTTFDP